MKSIGRELTEKGFKKMKQMDSNGNGKIEEGEVILGEDSEGNDYFSIECIGINTIGCFINVPPSRPPPPIGTISDGIKHFLKSKRAS